ncbi:MAG: hypothetical protein Kow0027_14020 [Saprospiraceae bacterium]
MKLLKFTCCLLFFVAMSSITHSSMAQTNGSELPYRIIPDYPDSYTPETVAARMIDGLGFRYYWATEGLRQEDLEFRPTEEARSSFETLVHIYGLSRTIRLAVEQKINDGSNADTPEDYEGLRKATLENLWAASELLKSGKVKLEDCNMVFKRGERTSEYPFWNTINGPIADAIWHCGQVVSFRRSSGNPFNSKVSVLAGTVRE